MLMEEQEGMNERRHNEGYVVRLNTAKAGLPWIHSPMDLNLAGLIFMTESGTIKRRLKQLDGKAGCKRF